MKFIILNDKSTNEWFKSNRQLDEFDRAALNAISTLYQGDTEEVDVDVKQIHKLLTNSLYCSQKMKEHILQSVYNLHKEKLIKGFKKEDGYNITEIPFLKRAKKSRQIISLDVTKLYTDIKKTRTVIGLQHYIIRRVHQHIHASSKLSNIIKLNDILNAHQQENIRRKDYIIRLLQPFNLNYKMVKDRIYFE